MLLQILQENPEGIPVGSNGTGAGIALVDQSLTERSLEGGSRTAQIACSWLPSLLGLNELLKSPGADRQQFRDARKIPVGTGNRCMPQVGGQAPEWRVQRQPLHGTILTADSRRRCDASRELWADRPEEERLHPKRLRIARKVPLTVS